MNLHEWLRVADRWWPAPIAAVVLIVNVLTWAPYLSTMLAVLFSTRPMVWAREAARSTQCKNNLRQFFVSMSLHSDNDPQTRLSSGAFDGRLLVDRFRFVASWKAGVHEAHPLRELNRLVREKRLVPAQSDSTSRS